MRSHSLALSIIATLTIAGWAASQPPVPDAVPVPAPVPPAMPPVDAPVIHPEFAGIRTPSLGDLVLAKVDLKAGAPRVIMMIQSYRQETKRVKVTRFVVETRERSTEVDGKTVNVPYTVKVPVTEEREITTNVPAGRKPLTIDAKDFQFFDLQAEEVSLDQAAQKLSSLKPVFLIDQNTGRPMPLPEVAQRALKAECLILVTKKQVRQFPAPAGAWVPMVAPAFVPVGARPPVPAPAAVPNVIGD